MRPGALVDARLFRDQLAIYIGSVELYRPLNTVPFVRIKGPCRWPKSYCESQFGDFSTVCCVLDLKKWVSVFGRRVHIFDRNAAYKALIMSVCDRS